MGVLGRSSRSASSKYGSQVKQGMEGDPKKRGSIMTMEGDASEVAQVARGEGSALSSFMPGILKCFDKMPSLQFKRPPDYNELLKMGQESITVAQSVTTELQRMQSDAPNGIHFMAFLGGFLLIIASANNFISHVFSLSPLHGFFSVMMVIFGIVMLVLEQQRAIFPGWMRGMLEHYFLFLSLIVGRGLFYMYVGSLQAAVNWGFNIYSLGIGVYVTVVGGIYIATGYSVQSKLSSLQYSLHSPEVIEAAFKKADADHSGELDIKELKTLMANLGSTLTEKEAEVTLELLDKNGNGTVSLEEFLKFMERKGSSHIF